MKAANPNLAMWLNCWWCGVSRASKKLFSILFVSGLFCCFCKLLQGDFGELVSMMECDPGYLMKTFHELCESRFYEGIGTEIYREQWDKKWRSVYDAN